MKVCINEESSRQNHWIELLSAHHLRQLPKITVIRLFHSFEVPACWQRAGPMADGPRCTTTIVLWQLLLDKCTNGGREGWLDLSGGPQLCCGFGQHNNVRSLLQCTCFTVKSECNLTIENQGWFYQTYKLLWDVLGTFHWGVKNKLKWPNVCMKWFIFLLSSSFLFGRGRGGILESAFDWSCYEILEPCRFLISIDSASRLLQLSRIPVSFCSFLFFVPETTTTTLYAFYNLVVRGKRAVMTPSEKVSVLQLFSRELPYRWSTSRQPLVKTNSPSFQCRSNLGLYRQKKEEKTMQTECIRSNGS